MKFVRDFAAAAAVSVDKKTIGKVLKDLKGGQKSKQLQNERTLNCFNSELQLRVFSIQGWSSMYSSTTLSSLASSEHGSSSSDSIDFGLVGSTNCIV